jgi:hypothetical protein
MYDPLLDHSGVVPTDFEYVYCVLCIVYCVLHLSIVEWMLKLGS